ncbi:tRNA (adenosine(37)-N6)-threonylcarbamoyltransferase complex ATPase subunit type 1 TsaE [Helicobacter mustelae]|uniref:tRNA threonylcarbamoyladenosine biosynthesis protein TsaE n=1 Tax=Helicobacter mustelae (strain ATCC 43772 / CCUG 25715 / CIP 103759 / LMG 18044 / NCTC 12198 / R85-136P) TaxID=679897 RepID=D3UIJ4_HELM1|nr:tRNA (adenosine(37)-N6)-threonylcarbamoyltransferase complex ATPase subunit type 1 TsaE [Helicobacter mustelae]CBG40317.1 putative ATP /GTP-binding protein [Helicobacter mustelae 12198]SQH71816.1 ATP /GTP-binding protein [Helicobacter mustelae]STP12945.1 ATP /GTP-binding protein [Helicobacter mustelae]
MTREFTLKEEELEPLFAHLDSLFAQHCSIFLLCGNLASGKTTLVQRYIKHINPSIHATSPTFSLMQEYDNFYHYDLYHHGLAKALELGLLENLEKEGVHFVEWGDEKLEGILKNSGYNYCKISIEKLQDKRNYKVVYG